MMKVCYFVMKNNELVEIDHKKVGEVATTCALMTTPVLPIHAADVANGGLQIKEAAQPIVEAIIELANPVSYACMIKGAMQVATGDEIKGKASMKNALMGYLVVKFTPQLFDFLDGLSFFK